MCLISCRNIQPKTGLYKSTIVKLMRLTNIIIAVCCCLHLSAQVSTSITLKQSNAPLEKVLQEITRQSGYDFLYRKELITKAKKVTIDINRMELRKTLDLVFMDQPFTYAIANKTIVVTTKTAQGSQQITEQPQTGPIVLNRSIHGKVFDTNGKALENATVQLKGTSLISTTDQAGNYTISVTGERDILIFSLVGFPTQEISVGKKTTLNVQMQVMDNNLTDMVITGYSTKKISEVTGSLQIIGGNDLRSGVSTANTLAMLKGKAAGLYIVETGNSNGSVSNRGQVIMRGQASLPDANNTNFGPLIVLDGVITIASNLQDIVDATDIESITLLKDAASTAIYGSRAAQGVLVVNTHRGTQGKISVNLNMNYGKVENNRLVNYMNTPQATAHMTKYMTALYNGTPSLQTQYGNFQNYFNTTRTFTDEQANTNYDWANNAFYQSGKQSDVNLSLSSGTDKTKFYGSVNWLKQDGTLLDDNLDRKSIRFNIDQKINNKLSIGINVNAIIDKYTASSGETQSFLFQPWVSPYKANGELADSITNYAYRAAGARNVRYLSDPLYHHDWNTTITSRQSYFGTGIIKYALTPWLTAQSTNTFNYIYNNVNTYRDPRTYRGKYELNNVYVNGELWLTDTKNTYYLTSNMLSFNKKIGNHHITGLLGQEFGRTHAETIGISGYDTPYPGERNLGAFLNYGNGSLTWISLLTNTPIYVVSAPSIDKASFSAFSELNDNYLGKYFGSLSLRRDASTNFGILNRYGTFYSVSGAWLINKEKFMVNIHPITNLKLRGSYGTSGREAGADFLNFTTYQESNSYGYNTTTTTGAAIQRLANEEITWETTHTTDIGVDINLWKRINLTVDFYNRRSSGLLQTVVLPSYQGSLSQIRNVGELVNRGLDIILSTTNIQSRNFSWTTDFNISFNTNKLAQIYGDSLKDGYTGSYYRYKGEDINSLRAIQYAGVNPDNGRPLFERVNADKSVTLVDSIPLVKQDGLRGFKNVGSATPKFFGGFTNTFRYKGISLTALFNFVYGNKILNNSVRNFISPSVWAAGQNAVQPNSAIRFWQGAGDKNANYPNYYDLAFSERGATNINSSLLYQDASYIRLRNVRLAYDLPVSLLNKMKVKSFNVYISSDNVFVIQSKELYAADPEGANIGTTSSNGYTGAGIYSAMPRKFFAGISVGF